MGKRKKRWVGGIIALLVAGLIAYGFAPRPEEVEMAEVKRGPMRVTVDDEGRTRVKDRFVVSAPVGGRLLRVPWRPGDPVIAGETILAEILPAPPQPLDARSRNEAQARVRAAEAAAGMAESNVERARTELEYAEREFNRTQRLHDESTASIQELDRARQRREFAHEDLRATESFRQMREFELEMARASLRWTMEPAHDDRLEIRAPVSGQVFRVFQESAGVVASGAPILETADLTDLEVVVEVLSSDAVRMQPGARVWLEHWGGNDLLEGRVRRVEPSAFTKVSALGVEEQRVNVIVDFDAPAGRIDLLGDGYRVEARIVIWEEPDVLYVPSGAVFRLGHEWQVFAVENGRAVRRSVEVGYSTGLQVQILSGLSEGQAVILYPSDRIADTTRVRSRD